MLVEALAFGTQRTMDETCFEYEPSYVSHNQQFPISSTRDDPQCPVPPPRTLDIPPAPLPSQPSYLQPRRKIQQGVWLYGSNVVYTADHPKLRAYILEAQATLRLPTTLPEPLLALAALELFYHPESPVHWLFWSDDKKRETAELVNRICLHQPQLIDCKKTSWNGTAEYLSVLSQVHGSGYRHRFEEEPWYAILVPPKVKSPARIPNLRKRKPAQLAALCEAQELDIGDDVADVLEPTRKRPRTKRTATDRAATQNASNQVSTQDGTISSQDNPPSSAPSPVPETPQSELTALPDIINHEATQSSQRVSSRVKKPKRTPDATPPPLMSSSSSSGSPSTSEIATPLPLPPTSVRVRSSSHSSAETLIDGHRTRSIDRLSVETAVQAVGEHTSNAKGKERELKLEAIDFAVADDTTLGDSDADFINGRTGMRTRARLLRASSASSVSTSPTVEEASDDGGVTKPAKKKSARSRRTKTQIRA